MKMPIFTLHPDFQDTTAYQECRVASLEEITLSRQKVLKNKFRSRKDMLNWCEQHDKIKFILGEYLATYLRELKVKKVLGLGSGECYYELAIKRAAPEIAITATDFDPFVVEKVAAFLPEIDKAEVFDIKIDDFARFQGKYDAVLMIGVDYALSNEEITDFLRQVIKVGARHIILLSAPYLTVIEMAMAMCWLQLERLKGFILRRQMTSSPGRFHGWARTKGEFVKATRTAGTVKLAEIITGQPFVKSQALLRLVPIN